LDNGIQPEVVELAEDWNNDTLYNYPRTDNVEKLSSIDLVDTTMLM